MAHWRSQRQWAEARRDAEVLIREGHSISDVARTLDVDRSTIGRWMTFGCFRLKDLEREEAGEPPLPRPDWAQREQYRKASKGQLPAEYAERIAKAQEELAASAKERVALMRENGGKLAVPEVDAEAFAKRAVAEAERLMGEGLYDLAERSMRIAERLARVKALLGPGAMVDEEERAGAESVETLGPDERWRRMSEGAQAQADLRKRLTEITVAKRQAPVKGMSWEDFEPFLEAASGDVLLASVRAVKTFGAGAEGDAE